MLGCVSGCLPSAAIRHCLSQAVPNIALAPSDGQPTFPAAHQRCRLPACHLTTPAAPIAMSGRLHSTHTVEQCMQGIPEESASQLTRAAAGCQRNMTSNLQPPMPRSARQPSTAARSLPAASRRRLLSCTAAAASSCCRALASASWALLLPAPDKAPSACTHHSSAAAALACSRS